MIRAIYSVIRALGFTLAYGFKFALPIIAIILGWKTLTSGNCLLMLLGWFVGIPLLFIAGGFICKAILVAVELLLRSMNQRFQLGDRVFMDINSPAANEIRSTHMLFKDWSDLKGESGFTSENPSIPVIFSVQLSQFILDTGGSTYHSIMAESSQDISLHDSFIFELAILSFHLIDRLVFDSLGPAKRDPFMNDLVHWTALGLSRTRDSDLEGLEYKDALIAAYNQSQLEYGKYKYTVPNANANANKKNTVSLAFCAMLKSRLDPVAEAPLIKHVHIYINELYKFIENEVKIDEMPK